MTEKMPGPRTKKGGNLKSSMTGSFERGHLKTPHKEVSNVGKDHHGKDHHVGKEKSGDTKSEGGSETHKVHVVESLFKLENTYQMRPEDGQKFMSAQVQEFMADILRENLDDKEYDSTKCSSLVTELTNTIKHRAKELKLTRYKLVIQVMIGQNGQQCVQVGSRCIWDQTTDNFASATYNSKQLFAVANCFGVYFE
jgi:hypothetical protein